MTLENLVERFESAASKTSPIGGILKFVLDDHIIIIDGSAHDNKISTEDQESDCTITTSLESLSKLVSGELNPMMAVMGGQVKIKGDMGLAMKLQSLLG